MAFSISWLSAVLIFTSSISAHANVSVIDDTGQTVILSQPARRVVALAPSATELVYFAGGLDKLVGVVAYSDFPEEAKSIQSLGQYNQVSIETLLMLKPDLVIGWEGGNSKNDVEKIKNLKLPIYLTDAKHLEDISRNVKNVGHLLGTDETALSLYKNMNNMIDSIKSRGFESQQKVFYQVWGTPLMTVNGEHLISEVISLCGGKNIFDDLETLSAKISLESVIQRDPEWIFLPQGTRAKEWQAKWQTMPFVSAVKFKRIAFINGDWISRQSPRILNAVEQVCGILNPKPEGVE